MATYQRRRTGGFARMTAFLLVAAVVLADVIRVGEYYLNDIVKFSIIYTSRGCVSETHHSLYVIYYNIYVPIKACLCTTI